MRISDWSSDVCSSDLVHAVNARLHDLTGIPLAYGVPLQCQRYEAGQEFKAHTDYFDPQGSDWDTYCAVPGQRSWTLMVYLNQPAAGGATRFLATGKMHQPEVGQLLAWNNEIGRASCRVSVCTYV